MTELMTQSQSPLAALLENDPELKQMLEADRQQQSEVSPSGSNLPPYKKLALPKSGGTAFELTEGNQTFRLPNVVCHVVHAQPFRQFWSGGRLLCQSDNSIQARNDPGFLCPNQICHECPHGAFKNRPDGTSERPDCSKKFRLFFLPCIMDDMNNQASPYRYPINEDGTLVAANVGEEPMYLDVPPTSLKAVKDYFENCAAFRGRLNLPYTALITLMKCSSAQGASGSYSKLSLTPIAEVAPYQFRYGKFVVDKFELKVSQMVDDSAPVTSTAPAPAPAQAPAPAYQPPAQPAAAPAAAPSPFQPQTAPVAAPQFQPQTAPVAPQNPATPPVQPPVAAPAPSPAPQQTAPAAPAVAPQAAPVPAQPPVGGAPPWMKK